MDNQYGFSLFDVLLSLFFVATLGLYCLQWHIRSKLAVIGQQCIIHKLDQFEQICETAIALDRVRPCLPKQVISC